MSRTTLLKVAFMVNDIQKEYNKFARKIRWEGNYLYITFEDGEKIARYLENDREQARSEYDYELLNQ